MKKFYLPILTALLMMIAGFAKAQTTYNSIATNPLNYTFDNPLYWVGGVTPPSPCVNCIININSNVTLTSAAGTLIIDNSTVQVNGNALVTVNTYIQAINGTHLIVGNDPTGASTNNARVVLNNEIGLESGSDIRLESPYNFINVLNASGQPITGPYNDYGVSPVPAPRSGIYYKFPTPVNGNSYSQVLTKTGIGTPTDFYGSQYSINCGTADGYPSDCKVGFIYGPALTQIDPSSPNSGAVFLVDYTLPVELVQFLASKNADGSVKVIWATAQEVNAGKYEVERSGDQKSFAKIGEVGANGNTSLTSNYSYTDRAPLSGTSYYRLKMIDLDGKYKYSPVAIVKSTADNTPLVIYSNPFLDQIRLKVNVARPQTLTITVTDVLGKNFIRQNYNATVGDNLINLTPANAASGMYVLKIHGTGYDQTVKLIKQ